MAPKSKSIDLPYLLAVIAAAIAGVAAGFWFYPHLGAMGAITGAFFSFGAALYLILYILETVAKIWLAIEEYRQKKQSK